MSKEEGDLDGHSYSVVLTSYADTIHVLVHKDDKIARMFKCQLYPQLGGVLSQDELIAGLSPESLVGSGGDDISGQLYTEMIGSLILKQNPEESRTLVLGLGNVGPRTNADITPVHRKELLHVVALVQRACKNLKPN